MVSKHDVTFGKRVVICFHSYSYSIYYCDLSAWDHSPGDNARQVQGSVLIAIFSIQFEDEGWLAMSTWWMMMPLNRDGSRYQNGWIFESFQKFMLQILDLYKGFFSDVFWKIFATHFPNMKGGGSRAVWNFSENSSVLVAWPVPYDGLNIFNGNGDLTSLGHANGPPLSPEQAEMPVRTILRILMRPLREYGGPLGHP